MQIPRWFRWEVAYNQPCTSLFWLTMLRLLFFQAFDEEDAVEIHEEERVLLADFEDLAGQLNAGLAYSGLSLWDFLQTHWSQMVVEYLEKNGKTDRVDSLCHLQGKKIVEEQ
ncbi:hypothetical protein BJY01DRAFT_243329 [Aspergillus pseudoustus]|uniref:Uncharacterized protein n=1 Tax=Aspergillus pseudoustus TaxID=1810923 RepID=A0ABR4KSU9_9EURO